MGCLRAPERIESAAFDFYCGKISHSQYHSILIEEFFDPENTVLCRAKDIGWHKNLRHQLDQFGAGLCDIYKEFYALTETAISSIEEAKLISTPLSEWGVRQIRSQLLNKRKPLETKTAFARRVCNSDVQHLVTEKVVKELPGTNIMIDLLYTLPVEAFDGSFSSKLPARRFREFEKYSNDARDIMHSLYLPYVDIFRCDRNVGGVLRKMKLPYQDAICSRPSDLVTMLRSLTH